MKLPEIKRRLKYLGAFLLLVAVAIEAESAIYRQVEVAFLGLLVLLTAVHIIEIWHAIKL